MRTIFKRSFLLPPLLKASRINDLASLIPDLNRSSRQHNLIDVIMGVTLHRKIDGPFLKVYNFVRNLSRRVFENAFSSWEFHLQNAILTSNLQLTVPELCHFEAIHGELVN